jgi:hypothetical protein
MADDLHARQPGNSLPAAVRDAAARAGRSRRPADPVLLARVRDALARPPDSASGRHYVESPGDCCLAEPHGPKEAW